MGQATPQSLAEMLQRTVAFESVNLRTVTEEQSLLRPAGAESWSRREELGHLIDSAVNNHGRFVRAALEPEFRGPGYDQNGWVNLHGYHDQSWAELIESWRQHNEALSAFIPRIPAAKLETPCTVGSDATVTLGFIIEDYVLHMQHHLDHILGREKLTQYPGAAAGI